MVGVGEVAHPVSAYWLYRSHQFDSASASKMTRKIREVESC